jgi:diadenylate cyclase
MFLTFVYSYIVPLIDILVVSFLVYRVLLLIKGTRAAPMLLGLTIIVMLYVLARILGLVTLYFVLGNVLSSIILVGVILFQEEIRRGLTKFGINSMFKNTGTVFYDKTIEDIALVCSKLSEKRIGALMAIQREVGLDEFVEDAVTLDAELNRKLLFSIFVKESALHDGAVLIEGDRIRAAGCVLPLSFDPDLDPNLGTRHRAALGLSERSDAILVVVSEENGAISLVRDGRMTRNLDVSMLRDALHRLLSTKEQDEQEGETAI